MKNTLTIKAVLLGLGALCLNASAAEKQEQTPAKINLAIQHYQIDQFASSFSQSNGHLSVTKKDRTKTTHTYTSTSILHVDYVDDGSVDQSTLSRISLGFSSRPSAHLAGRDLLISFGVYYPLNSQTKLTHSLLRIANHFQKNHKGILEAKPKNLKVTIQGKSYLLEGHLLSFVIVPGKKSFLPNLYDRLNFNHKMQTEIQEVITRLK